MALTGFSWNLLFIICLPKGAMALCEAAIPKALNIAGIQQLDVGTGASGSLYKPVSPSGLVSAILFPDLAGEMVSGLQLRNPASL